MTMLHAQTFPKRALALLATYFLLAVGAIALSRQEASIATLWYANAAAMACLQRTSGRQWMQLLGVAALANALANLSFGQPIALVLSFLPGNLLEIAVGSYFLQRVCSTKGFLVNPLEMGKTLLLAGVVPILFGSVIGAAVLSAYGLAAFDKVWFPWFEGSAIGSLSTLPLGIFLLEGGWKRIVDKLRHPTFVLAFPVMLVASWLALTRLPFPWIYVAGLLVLLTLITRWAGASVGIFLCSIAVGAISATGGLPLGQYAQVSLEFRLFLPLLVALLIPLFLACVLEKLEEQKGLIEVSQKQLRDLYEKTPAMLHTLDNNGAIRFVSDRWLERMGYSRNEVVGRKVFEFMVPADAKLVQDQRFPQFKLEGSIRAFPLRMQSRNAEPIAVELSSVLVGAGYSEETHALSILEEVTERNLAREKAERQTLLLEDVVDSVPYGMVVYDEKHNLRFTNQAFVDILRLPASLLKKPGFAFSDLVAYLYARGDYGTQQSRAQVEARFVGAMKAWQRMSLERQQPDGSFIEMEAIPLPSGWIVMTYLDVTTRRLEQRSLVESKERVQLATESSGVGLWELDFAKGGLKWDAQLYRLYGLEPKDEIVDYAFWASHVHPDDLADAESRFQEAIQRGEAVELDYRITWPNGEIRHIKALGRPRLNEAGVVVYMVGTNRDVTEETAYAHNLRAARDLAHDASLAKGSFLANMSHELRTPMNAVLGLLQLLGNTALTSNQFDYVEKIDGAAKSLLGLLNDILDFSKIEAGKLDLDVRPFRLDQFLRELAVVLSTYVGMKKIDVLYDIDASLPKVLQGDPLRLRQVLINLGGNAIKFTETGQVVISLKLIERVPASESGPESVAIEFSVADSGIGIAPENLPKMFNSFTQAEASTTRKFGGTGLGLAISKLLVELMGGQIALSSTLNVGTTFSFPIRMPVDIDSAIVETDFGESQPPVSSNLEPSTGTLNPVEHHVLLVDDNAVATELMSKMMRAFGWSVNAVSSGNAAMEALKGHLMKGGKPITLVFVDWQMLPTDGWQIVDQICQLCAARLIPCPKFVMVSANGRASLDLRTREEQSLLNDFLVKPVTASMLYNASLDKQQLDISVRRAPRSNKRVLAGVRILVVEDNAINQQVAEELLTSQGADVSIAADGEIAVNAIAAAKIPYDIVLMDVQMPVMDGFEATKVIRQGMGLPNLPIVGLTANAMASDRDDCLRAGMNEHIGKPFDLAQLVSVVIRLTGHKPNNSQVEPGAEYGSTTGDGPHHLGFQKSESQSIESPSVTIDMASALSRMGGIEKLYIRSARDLMVVLPTVTDTLSLALKAGDRRHCAMLLHTIKGNAATLGLNLLAKNLADLESLCKDENNFQTCGVHLQELSRTIDAAQAALKGALESLERPLGDAEGGVAHDSGLLKSAIERLTPLLESEDFAALEVFSEERAALEALPEEVLGELEAALQDLDWAAGLKILKSTSRLN
jgi:PAS domain S-box-containing protein